MDLYILLCSRAAGIKPINDCFLANLQTHDAETGEPTGVIHIGVYCSHELARLAVLQASFYASEAADDAQPELGDDENEGVPFRALQFISALIDYPPSPSLLHHSYNSL